MGITYLDRAGPGRHVIPLKVKPAKCISENKYNEILSPKSVPHLEKRLSQFGSTREADFLPTVPGWGIDKNGLRSGAGFDGRGPTERLRAGRHSWTTGPGRAFDFAPVNGPCGPGFLKMACPLTSNDTYLFFFTTHTHTSLLYHLRLNGGWMVVKWEK